VAIDPDHDPPVAGVAEIERPGMRVIPDTIPRNVRDGDVGATVTVVLQSDLSPAGSLHQHVLIDAAADHAEVVVVGDEPQSLRGSVGEVFLLWRSRIGLRVSARLALDAAQ